MQVSEILKITRGKLLSGNPLAEIDLSKVSTDSRTIERGVFFIALKGPNFDGNEFVESAFKKGAVGAIVSGDAAPADRKISIKVNDTLRALQEIALHHRRRFNIPVIAITGSNGKTTVKEMIAKVLSTKYNVLKNEGTKNNHIGVPQTLLKLEPKHQVCVLELGTNHEGEMRNLSAIARPTIAVITNIGPSHLEFLGDLDGVYNAKREIIDFLDKKGLLVLNGDDRYLSGMKAKGRRVMHYGFGRFNDFTAEALPPGKNKLRFVVNRKMVFELNLFGTCNIYNALAAIAVASQFDVGYKLVREALFEYRPTAMRLNLKKINGIDIIDDSYNSNPLSMMTALEVIKHYPARAKWVVAGDMLELGKEAVRFHKMAGEWVARSNVTGVVAIGELSRHILSQAGARGIRRNRLWHCPTHNEIANVLKKVAKKGDVILLKGSRGMRLEQVIGKLRG